MEKNKQEPQLKITTDKKIRGLLQSVLDEGDLWDDPRSYNLEKVFCGKGYSNPSKAQVFSVLERLGFKVASSYLQPLVFKTDAPFEKIF